MESYEIPLQAAEHQRKAKRAQFGELGYTRFTDGFRGIPRGTVVAGDDVLWGYPSIGRVLSLEAGLGQQLGETFWLEEKIDGYNVRIAAIGDDVVAFSRGGFACPFTNDRLPELLDFDVFDHEPDLVVCCEVAGPGNPYLPTSPPHVAEDVELFVFDCMRKGRPGFIDQREKQALVERFGLPTARSLGRFTARDIERIHSIVAELDAAGCEGVVIKDDADADKRVKYVTGAGSINDIRVSASDLLDEPPEFYIDRVLRLAVHLVDQNREADSSVREALGGAFLDRLLEELREFPDRRRVSQKYRCRFRSRANAEAYVGHLERMPESEAQVVNHGIERDGDGWLLTFEKVSPRITGLLAHLTRGGLVYDS